MMNSELKQYKQAHSKPATMTDWLSVNENTHTISTISKHIQTCYVQLLTVSQ